MSYEANHGAQQENVIEDQFILRVPLRVANAIRSSKDKEELSLSFEMKTTREGKFYFQYGNEQKTYNLTLVDLPTFTETHKTIDSRIYYKSADIGQMILVEDLDEEPPFNAPILNKDTWTLDSGITHPTRHIRENKWRKQYHFPVNEVQEVVKYITRLMKKDDEFELVEIVAPKNAYSNKHAKSAFGGLKKDATTDTMKKNTIQTTTSSPIVAIANETEKKALPTLKVLLPRPSEASPSLSVSKQPDAITSFKRTNDIEYNKISTSIAPTSVSTTTTTTDEKPMDLSLKSTTTTSLQKAPSTTEIPTIDHVLAAQEMVDKTPVAATPSETEAEPKTVNPAENRIKILSKIQEITKKIADSEKVKTTLEFRKKTETNRVMLKRLVDDISKRDEELKQLKSELVELNNQLEQT